MDGLGVSWANPFRKGDMPEQMSKGLLHVRHALLWLLGRQDPRPPFRLESGLCADAFFVNAP